MSELRIPNLAGVITKADVDTKGTGSYAASYVNWAKVAHLLHEHATGWEFRLRPTVDGSLLHQAPDGTAFVIGYFDGPNGEQLADFPFPCMDNRNNPIQLDKVSARTLTDTHRRALCAAAAFTFGLAYELWAKEEVEDPHREDAAPAKPQPQQAKAQPAKSVKSSPTPAQPVAKPAKAEPSPELPADVQPPLDPAERSEILQLLKEMMSTNKTAFDQFIAEYRAKFNLDASASVSNHLQERQHADFAQQFFASLPPA